MNHPNIIHLHEVYEGVTNVYLILEYLKGGDLFSLIKTKTKYSEDIVIMIMTCVMSALSYIHSLNICHRDLKPENLILVLYLNKG